MRASAASSSRSILKGTGCRPAPGNILPKGAISKRKLDRWWVRYVAKSAGNPYPVHGLIAISHPGGEIQGFALAQVWVPAAQARTADAMLDSFTFR